MTDQTESASEYADLLSNLDPAAWFDEYNIHKHVAVTMREAAAAIRALEAKVREWQFNADVWHEGYEAAIKERDEFRADRDRLSEALAVEQRLAKSWQETAEKFRGERDRLAGEVERLHSQLDTALALRNQERERNDWLLKRISEGQALMPPAPMLLLDRSAEVARLTSELAELRGRTDAG